MRIKHLVAALAAVSMTAPAAAQSAAALSLARSPAVAGAETESASELGSRRGLGWLLIPIALGILVFVVVQLQDENELPGSP